jgi:phage baseplate assembly protein gpV
MAQNGAERPQNGVLRHSRLQGAAENGATTHWRMGEWRNEWRKMERRKIGKWRKWSGAR